MTHSNQSKANQSKANQSKANQSKANQSKANQSNGRLVWNHSTHIPGLIPILEKLINFGGINTVTPGVISRAKGHAPRLKVRISVPIRGGFKAIARQGKTVQEVFIVTDLAQTELEEAIEKCLR